MKSNKSTDKNNTRTLILMRHAESPMAVNGNPDYDRFLSEKGQEQAVAVGKQLLQQQIHPQLVLVSSARRTLETAAAVLSGYEQQPEIRSLIDLYEKPSGFTVAYLKKLESNPDPVLIIGHNPHIGELIGDFSGEAIHVRPGMAAVFHLEIPDWHHISKKRAILQEVIDPRELLSKGGE